MIYILTLFIRYNYFCYQHSKDYQQVQFKFLDAVESLNPNNIMVSFGLSVHLFVSFLSYKAAFFFCRKIQSSNLEVSYFSCQGLSAPGSLIRLTAEKQHITRHIISYHHCRKPIGLSQSELNFICWKKYLVCL